NNFDFLARSFARMHAEGRPVDILAVTGNMDEEHRTWFCARYALRDPLIISPKRNHV
ncbi:hypothetical protein DNO50_25295, partial [Escherichia coli]|nr:hypothetical protein [Escherichia coli]NVF73024.1 hypothetical protein [Escherichia coli]